MCVNLRQLNLYEIGDEQYKNICLELRARTPIKVYIYI